jgi:predicted DNA-binding transcriptional regulator AlpA
MSSTMTRKPQAPVPAPRRDPDEKLKLAEVCAELRIERSTFYDWRAKGRAPKCSKLPNGELRIVRRDLDEWFESCRVA